MRGTKEHSMGVSSLNGISRMATTTADSPSASLTTPRPLTVVQEVEIDKVTKQPLPPRFPWLSRLSQQLEAAARQRPAFPAAPVLGDHLDRSA
jgi:hypothetical protein